MKKAVPALFNITLLAEESTMRAAIRDVESLVACPEAPIKDIVLDLVEDSGHS